MVQSFNPFEPGDRFHVGSADTERVEVRVLSRATAAVAVAGALIGEGVKEILGFQRST